MKYEMQKISQVEHRILSSAKEGMQVPVTIYASDDLLVKMETDRTIDQAVNVTYLRGVRKHVIVLPDGHEGYGFPIGGVAATNFETGVISPGGVGYDINCGVRLIRTNLREKDIRPKLQTLVRTIFNAVPSGLGSSGAISLSTSELDRVLLDGINWAIDNGYATSRDREYCEENGKMQHCDPSRVSDLAKKRGAKSLGTLGSGNHFLEIETVNQLFDQNAARSMGLESPDQICVLIHTGSRGLGHQVCSDYLRIVERSADKYKIELPDRELACAPAGSREAEDYRLAMGAALNYAWANRQFITNSVRRAFERALGLSESDLGMNLVYDVAHNICKVEEHSVDFDNPKKKEKVFVHRKGATRAFPKGRDEIPIAYRSIGQPVFIPGSMGTASWVLLGQEKSLDASFGSTAHGAGRFLSRAAATRAYPYLVVKQALEERGIILESASRKGVVEEAPGAYKDVDAVAEVSDKVGIASKVCRLTPIAVVKG
ncbi:MAG: RtcB family protein [Nitrososphaerota archaeon]|nr:RtcB family protein [Nitrososphaerota archaeon]